jgi:D-alanyl-D-alanine carboxypeptidase
MILKRIKIFIAAFIFSFIFFAGINVLEKDLTDFLYWYDLGRNSQIFAAQISLEQKWQEAKPIKNKQTINLEIKAKSAVSVFINQENKEKILFQSAADQKLPIASLTKLMTALVVLEYYDLEKEIVVSDQAANQIGDAKKLEPGKKFKTSYFLYPLLIESSNGAASALSNDYPEITEKDFVQLMNQEAEKIGMTNTFFFNPTGLDPENQEAELNYSTSNDLIKLVKKILEKPIITEILSLPKYFDYGPELINTNRLLLDNNDWQERIIGGKTGYTRKADGCLILILRAPKSQGFLINVVLGANGRELRFEEMKKLVNWLKITYKW